VGFRHLRPVGLDEDQIRTLVRVLDEDTALAAISTGRAAASKPDGLPPAVQRAARDRSLRHHHTPDFTMSGAELERRGHRPPQ